MSYGNGEKRTIGLLEAELSRLMAENERLRAVIIPRYKFLMKLFEDGCYMNEQEKSDLADMAPLLVEAALKGEPK